MGRKRKKTVWEIADETDARRRRFYEKEIRRLKAGGKPRPAFKRRRVKKGPLFEIIKRGSKGK